MSNFKDDVYESIKNEFEQIQRCTGMYIGAKGRAGMLHLFKEIFNNSLDECINEGSPANKIIIIHDPVLNMLTAIDNGRGIPFEKLVEVTTTKHSGTKIGRKFNKRSTGCNGVGMTVTNAYSEKFIITSYRTGESSGDKEWDGYQKTLEFTNCLLTEHEPVKQKGKPIHGLMVQYIPSTKYLGEEIMTDDDVLEWLRHINYIIYGGITIDYINKDITNDKVNFVRKFSGEGLEGSVLYNAIDPTVDPVSISYIGDEIDMDFVFTYDKNIDEEKIDSYCNFAVTTEGGFHVAVCRRAVSDFLVKASKKDDPDHKYEVISQDCRKGLVMAVSCFYANVDLGGQHKSSVTSKEVEDIKPDLTKLLNEYFSVNNSQLGKIISFLRQNARARLETNKIKGIKPPKQMSVYDAASIDGFFPLSGRSKGYCELFIAEGDSAINALIKAINPDYQAGFSTRGVIANSTNLTIDAFAKSQKISNLIKILGCGYGAHFDINNLRWNKVIIVADADVDGNFIRSLLCLCVILGMPQLITEGRLFVGIPPLYELTEKTEKKYKLKNRILYDKREYQNLINTIIANNIDFALIDDENHPEPFNKNNTMSWLRMNQSYITELVNLSDNTKCNQDILEQVCWQIAEAEFKLTQKFEDGLVKALGKHFPEMEYDANLKSISGSYNCGSYTLIIDTLFVEKANKFINILYNNPSLFVIYRNKSVGGEYTRATIGKFLKDIHGSYAVDVDQRFKGLGEASSTLLFYTTLNPKVRKLIRLTMDDYEKALRDMDNLHGKKNVEFRRNLLKTIEITSEDLDS